MKKEKITRLFASKDMTEGSITRHMLEFCLPLLIGNAFQLLYNMVDSLVVGNFVGTQALAAVGSTTMIVNMVVFFFNGLSTGATVLIGQSFGSHHHEKLHTAIETTMALTFLLSIVFTIAGVAGVPYLLRFMSTPEDVMKPATIYLRIYFASIAGLLVYNMGSGILRAVGDSMNPLIFLMFTSVLNTVLDLLFVVIFQWGIAGAAFATALAQIVSAVMIVLVLIKTDDVYRFSFEDMEFDTRSLSLILKYGLPAALQSTLTAFSNVFVQSYINAFGSACMAGWSCYNKIDQLIYLPMQSMAVAATAFVSQNTGAGKLERADLGTKIALMIVETITVAMAAVIFVTAPFATGLFTKDSDVVYYGVLFLRMNVFFLCFNTINHTLAGALRGKGDAIGPTIIMLSTFVGLRQLYLLLVTRYVADTPVTVGLGYPVGWVSCCVVELAYFYYRIKKKPVGKMPTAQ